MLVLLSRMVRSGVASGIEERQTLMKKLRIYADTSVFGGCFDDEFSDESRRFFAEINAGRFALLVSDSLLAELASAPEEVRQVLRDLSPEQAEVVTLNDEMVNLRDAYVEAGVVGSSSLEDAEHIAIATVAGADMVVSWNFRHIVHFEKIAGYNAVNLLHGYGPLRIFSPREVVEP